MGFYKIVMKIISAEKYNDRHYICFQLFAIFFIITKIKFKSQFHFFLTLNYDFFDKFPFIFQNSNRFLSHSLVLFIKSQFLSYIVLFNYVINFNLILNLLFYSSLFHLIK